MKLTLSLWATQLAIFAISTFTLISCHYDRFSNPVPEAPAPVIEESLPVEKFPDVIESMPNIMVYAYEESIDELEKVVALEVSEKAKQYGIE
jgi:hypothetical protein